MRNTWGQQNACVRLKTGEATMMRLLIQTVLTVLANAIGLLVATYFLDDFTINTSSFILAVLVFSAATIILGPFIVKVAMQSATFLMGGIALVTTLVGLLITTAFTDGLEIDGISTWFIATFIIWIASVAAQMILPFILAKLALTGDSDKPQTPAPPTPTNLPGPQV